MNPTTEHVRERHLDILLEELLMRPPASSPVRARTWRRVAVAAGIAVTLAVAWSATPDRRAPSQGKAAGAPATASTPEELGALPADTPGLRCMGLGDDDLAGLRRFTALRSLELRTVRARPTMTDEGLSHVAGLQQLEELHLDAQPITTVAPLRGLRRLRVLTLVGTAVDDAGLTGIGELRQLEELRLDYCRRVGDAGVTRALSLAKLRHLSLGGLSWLSERTLLGLSGLRELRVLRLHNVEGRPRSGPGEGLHELVETAGVTDAVLQKIGTLPHLRELDLSILRGLQDPSLGHLRECATLRKLDLHWCDGLSDDGIAQLPAGIESLKLFGTKVRGHVLGRFTDLRDLDISYATNVDLETIGRLLAGPAQKTLRRLVLSGLRHLDARVLSKVAELPLRELVLVNCPWVDDDTIGELGPLRGTLERLDVTMNPGLSDACLAHFAGFQGLRELVARNVDLSAAAVAALRRELPRLQVQTGPLTGGAGGVFRVK